MDKKILGDLCQALKAAHDMEKSGYDIYMKAAEKTSNKLGKSTLEAIAKKELDHIKAIDEFTKKATQGDLNLAMAISSINVLDKKDYVRPIMDKLAKELDEKVKSDSDLEKAYEVAMQLERESYDFYKDLADQSADPQVKKFFEFLMSEENTHYELLQESLEYLNHPGDWFKEQERWIMEG
ncbi:MAG: ferritin family protein [Candidatus Margulisbacteria bacterium]|nr:ferritin family protein [Candidatus Margulisiibacteriota bacterium]MBU1022372.1 ferritin family protein [Candidatus Margulisiibacteriota bacterium]MBU1729076.1 ferritin family protein [Candidatus Margulisiibacteriota bacterium]MBU1954503.1 ferritin family protein [Candidatus Margulisiibacteriota bacterium]